MLFLPSLALPHYFGVCSCIDILRGDKSVWFSIGYTPIAMLDTCTRSCGNNTFYFILSSFCSTHKQKQQTEVLYRNKIITSPNFIYRMRSNSKTLIMLTLLSAKNAYRLQRYGFIFILSNSAVSRMAPSEIECRIENESEIDAIKQIVNEHSSKNDVSFLQTNIYKVTSTSEQVPLEYSAGSSKGDSDNEKFCEMQGLNVSLIQTI